MFPSCCSSWWSQHSSLIALVAASKTSVEDGASGTSLMPGQTSAGVGFCIVKMVVAFLWGLSASLVQTGPGIGRGLRGQKVCVWISICCIGEDQGLLGRGVCAWVYWVAWRTWVLNASLVVERSFQDEGHLDSSEGQTEDLPCCP